MTTTRIQYQQRLGSGFRHRCDRFTKPWLVVLCLLWHFMGATAPAPAAQISAVPAGTTGTNVLYVSPLGSDIAAQVGNPTASWATLEAATTNLQAGWTMVVLPGNYTVNSGLKPPDSATILISRGAVVTNNVFLGSDGPMILLTNNLTLTLDGMIYDPLIGSSERTVYCPIGSFDRFGAAKSATNFLINGTGQFISWPEVLSIETTNPVSGRVEGVYMSSYHSTVNLVFGGFDIVFKNVTMRLNQDPLSTFGQTDQALLIEPNNGFTNNIYLDGCVLDIGWPGKHAVGIYALQNTNGDSIYMAGCTFKQTSGPKITVSGFDLGNAFLYTQIHDVDGSIAWSDLAVDYAPNPDTNPRLISGAATLRLTRNDTLPVDPNAVGLPDLSIQNWAGNLVLLTASGSWGNYTVNSNFVLAARQPDDASALTNLNAAQLQSGSVPNAVLAAGYALTNLSARNDLSIRDYAGGSQTLLEQSSDGHLTITPDSDVHVSGKLVADSFSAPAGGALTPLQFTTNDFAWGGNAIAFTNNFQFVTTNNNFSIRGFLHINPSMVNWAVLSVSNSSTVPITVRWPPGVRQYTANSGGLASVPAGKVWKAIFSADPHGTNVAALPQGN